MIEKDFEKHKFIRYGGYRCYDNLFEYVKYLTKNVKKFKLGNYVTFDRIMNIILSGEPFVKEFSHMV